MKDEYSSKGRYSSEVQVRSRDLKIDGALYPPFQFQTKHRMDYNYTQKIFWPGADGIDLRFREKLEINENVFIQGEVGGRPVLVDIYYISE